MARDIARRTSGQLARADTWPEALTKVINAEKWARAIAFGEKYVEPIPEFLSRMLAIETMTAASMEEVFASAGVTGLQEWVLDRPGETSGPILIDSLYVAESAYEDGNPAYVIFEGAYLENGQSFKVSTGSTSIQAAFIGMLNNGHWPIRCQIKRGENQDKGGKYMLFMFPPD